MDEIEILKLIKSKEEAISKNIIPSKEFRGIIKALEDFLDLHLNQDDILSLEYQKFKKTQAKRFRAIWDHDGYPIDGQIQIRPWKDFFERYITNKKIINRLEDENLWVESRAQGKDQHLFIGNKDDKTKKVHLIIDNGTGEIRVDRTDQMPSEILKRVEAILTTKDGRKVKSIMDFGGGQ